MVQVNTEITGLKELSKNSKALKEALGEDVLVSALVDTGKDISKDAQDRAPQGSTGRARRGIRWLLRRGDKPGDKSVDIGWTSDVVHGSLLETGTSQQEAQPHLRPAVDEGHASGRIDNRFIEGVNSAIARILGRS